MSATPAAAAQLRDTDCFDGWLLYIRDILSADWTPQKQMHAIWIISQKWAYKRLQHCQVRPAKHRHKKHSPPAQISDFHV